MAIVVVLLSNNRATELRLTVSMSSAGRHTACSWLKSKSPAGAHVEQIHAYQ